MPSALLFCDTEHESVRSVLPVLFVTYLPPTCHQPWYSVILSMSRSAVCFWCCLLHIYHPLAIRPGLWDTEHELVCSVVCYVSTTHLPSALVFSVTEHESVRSVLPVLFVAYLPPTCHQPCYSVTLSMSQSAVCFQCCLLHIYHRLAISPAIL